MFAVLEGSLVPHAAMPRDASHRSTNGVINCSVHTAAHKPPRFEVPCRKKPQGTPARCAKRGERALEPNYVWRIRDHNNSRNFT